MTWLRVTLERVLRGMLRSAHLLCVLLAVSVLTFPAIEGFAASTPLNARYVYRLDYRGSADITVIINATGRDYVKLSLEPGFLDGTLTVYTENGTPLYFNVSNGVATIYTYGQVNILIAEYLAQVGNVSEEVIVNATIHPQGPASVFLPQGTALTYVTGNPDINFMNGSIVLLFSKPGTYSIEYVVIPSTQASVTVPSTASLSTTTSESITSTIQTTTQSSRTQASTYPSSAFPQQRLSQYLPFIGLAVVVAAIAAFTLIKSLRRRPAITEPEVTSGLDERDLAILSTLAGGELSLSDIARKVGLNKSVVWRRVNRMMREGYLERRAVKGRTMYRLTEKGLRAISNER